MGIPNYREILVAENGSGLIVFTLDMEEFIVVYFHVKCILQCASAKEAYNILVPRTLVVR
jgi:chemotaxis signal transduction protein